MKTDGLIGFLGWASLTFIWLNTNLTFFNLIHAHKEVIRRKAIEEYEDESEDESEDDGEDE